MSELQDAERMLEAAAHAAAADDLTSADQLLRGAARIQEAELGPLHPDLANTLNNLAIVAEKTGRLGDAETFYRRAVAIAAASLPADHPMVAASRENLEEFCRAQGLPIDIPAVTTPAPADAERPSPPRVSTSRVIAAIGVAVVLLILAVLVRRSMSSRETPAAVPTAVPQAADRTEPTRAEPASPAPVEQQPPPAAEPQHDAPDMRTDKAPAPLRSSDAIALISAQLCRTFSTSGARWACDPVGDPVSPGAIVLYTRVKSPHDAIVEHRWYRGEHLRQSVKLAIRANAIEGYRTYSRQTVDAGADWRVEVRSADGTLLHEQRFVVR